MEFYFPHYRNNFKDYTLQSRLHFRIHAAQGQIKADAENAEKGWCNFSQLRFYSFLFLNFLT